MGTEFLSGELCQYLLVLGYVRSVKKIACGLQIYSKCQDTRVFQFVCGEETWLKKKTFEPLTKFQLMTITKKPLME